MRQTTQQQTKFMLEFAKDMAQIMADIFEQSFDMHVKARAEMIKKPNVERAGIILQNTENSIVCPTVYVEDAYFRHVGGEDKYIIADELVRNAYEAFEHSPELPDLTTEEAKKHITLTLINTGRNQELLTEVPHFEVGDLSAIPRWQISEEASFIVKNDMASRLMLTPDEVLTIGHANVNRETFKIQSMHEVLAGMLPEEIRDEATMVDENPMMVITSQSQIYGSKAILSQNVLDEVYERIGDFVVLPSSQHEVIAIPIPDNQMPEDIRELVREVNETQVNEQDFLSDNIMVYDGQKLFMALDSFKAENPEINISAPKMNMSMM